MLEERNNWIVKLKLINGLLLHRLEERNHWIVKLNKLTAKCY